MESEPMHAMTRVIRGELSGDAGPIRIWDHLRRWHVRPWKRTSLLDNALAGEGDTSADDSTSAMDVFNNLITQAGNVMTAKNSPYGTTVKRPLPGQAVPNTGLGLSSLGISTTTLLILGAAVAGFLILKKK